MIDKRRRCVSRQQFHSFRMSPTSITSLNILCVVNMIKTISVHEMCWTAYHYIITLTFSLFHQFFRFSFFFCSPFFWKILECSRSLREHRTSKGSWQRERHLQFTYSTMSNKHTLTYLPLRALSEGAQLVLRAGNIDYEMVYCPFEEWATHKPDPEFSKSPRASSRNSLMC